MYFDQFCLIIRKNVICFDVWQLKRQQLRFEKSGVTSFAHFFSARAQPGHAPGLENKNIALSCCTLAAGYVFITYIQVFWGLTQKLGFL